MGSRNPERDRFLASDYVTVRDWWLNYPDWALQASCNGCIGSIQYHAADWIRGRNPPYDLADLKLRFVCPSCGCRLCKLIPTYVGKRRD